MAQHLMRLHILLVCLAVGVSGLLFQKNNAKNQTRLTTAPPLPVASSHATTPKTPVFRYVYITHAGAIVKKRAKTGEFFELAASPKVNDAALMKAAHTVSKFVKHMSRDGFSRLASKGKAGIFTRQEKLTIYPEFFHLRNGHCGHSCTGRCKSTCTFDGRKWDDIKGATGSRSVALDENVVCARTDPYRHTLSILIHELGHMVRRIGLTREQQTRVMGAFRQAKKDQTWGVHSYAMATVGEYFATATSVFFHANRESGRLTGGMNICHRNGTSQTFMCNTEDQARDNIAAKDPNLFKILVHIYDNDNPKLRSGLSVCP